MEKTDTKTWVSNSAENKEAAGDPPAESPGRVKRAQSGCGDLYGKKVDVWDREICDDDLAFLDDDEPPVKPAPKRSRGRQASRQMQEDEGAAHSPEQPSALPTAAPDSDGDDCVVITELPPTVTPSAVPLNARAARPAYAQPSKPSRPPPPSPARPAGDHDDDEPFEDKKSALCAGAAGRAQL